MTKRGLGRGIDALLSAALAERDVPLSEISVYDISHNKFQPRRVFDDDAMAELEQSIRQFGVLQPIIVRQVLGGFELVAGERRLRAARKAELLTIPALIKEFSDAQMAEIALIENIQRENLNVIEEAIAYRRLMDDFGLTQEDVANKIGRSRSMIANVVRLLKLAPEVQDHVSRGTLSMGQVRPLLGLEDYDKQIEAANTIIEEDLSARDSEELVRRLLNPPVIKEKKPPEPKEIFVGDIEERLKLILGTQVKIKPGKLKSRIEIEFYSPDDLERIVEVLIAKQQMANIKPMGSLVV
ncbi:MAG: parB-like partition protein [Firmicutes bacterium]|nr:parB-like partition protein [Bacillota bacterium]